MTRRLWLLAWFGATCLLAAAFVLGLTLGRRSGVIDAMHSVADMERQAQSDGSRTYALFYVTATNITTGVLLAVILAAVGIASLALAWWRSRA
jgi:hypothetical protein